MESNLCEDWKLRIQNQQTSGLSIAKWCRQNNLNSEIFYYWNRKFYGTNNTRKKTPRKFIELKEGANFNLRIEVNGFKVLLDNTETLKQFLIAVKNL